MEIFIRMLEICCFEMHITIILLVQIFQILHPNISYWFPLKYSIPDTSKIREKMYFTGKFITIPQ